MAVILNEMQAEQIKALNRQFKPYAEKGWMCEGSDAVEGAVVSIFNNDTDELFFASARGEVLEHSLIKDTPFTDLIDMARIQGRIATIA